MTEFKEELEKPRHKYVDAGEASHIYLLPNSLTAGNLSVSYTHLTLPTSDLV